MRLSRPGFMPRENSNLEPWDLANVIPSQCSSNVDSGNDNMETDIGLQFFPQSGLQLPQSFGFVKTNNVLSKISTYYLFRTIYLGETFQSYLRIQNVSSTLVSNITIQVFKFILSYCHIVY